MWPTNIPLQPETYDKLFTNTTQLNILRTWATAYYGGAANLGKYQLGDLVIFFLNEGHKLTPQVRITLEDATEWREILAEHFDKKKGRKAIERVIITLLRNTTGEVLNISVSDDDDWTFDPTDPNQIRDVAAGQDGHIKVKSPRRWRRIRKQK